MSRRLILFCFLFFPIFSDGWVSDITLDLTQWTQLSQEPLVVYCHQDDIKNGKRVIEIGVESIPQICRDLEFSIVEKIMIIITSSESEFDLFTQDQIPEWGVAAANPIEAIIYLKSPRFAHNKMNLEQTVIHELAHAVLGMVVQGNRIDSWFDEGFAMFESEEWRIGGGILLSRSFLMGQEIRLDAIDEVLTFHRDKASLAYQESMAAVEYLVERYGIRILSRIAWAIRQGLSMDEALFEIIGIGFEDFQSEWLEAMKIKYRWYLFMDVPLILSFIFIILFMAAFIVTKRRMSQKRREWERFLPDEVEEIH